MKQLIIFSTIIALGFCSCSSKNGVCATYIKDYKVVKKTISGENI